MKIWTNEEIGFLQKNSDLYTDQQLAEKLDRTRPSIRGKRYRLEIKKSINKGQFKKLPVPDKTVLEEIYLVDNQTPSRIGEIYNVSSGTVRLWLRDYGIPVKRPFTSKLKPNLSETDKAYLAGLMDGDGTINMGKFKNKRARTGFGVSSDVAFITTYKHFADKIYELIGGDLKTFIYKDSREKKEGYRVTMSNARSRLALLELIEPYLILKKERAQTMIEYINSRLEARDVKGNGAPISDSEWSLIEDMRRTYRRTPE